MQARKQSPDTRLTALLSRWQQGDATALERLMPMVHHQLKSLARRQMFAERRDHTLQPTALVNEAYLRMCEGATPSCTDRTHFFAVAAKVMRQILVDHARGRLRQRRGGEWMRTPLDDSLEISLERPERFLALDDALSGLERVDSRKAQVVQLRFFGGMGLDEVGEFLGISQATVVRDWRMARTWLLRELRSGSGEPRLAD